MTPANIDALVTRNSAVEPVLARPLTDADLLGLLLILLGGRRRAAEPRQPGGEA